MSCDGPSPARRRNIAGGGRSLTNPLLRPPADLQHNICMRMQDSKLFISPAGKDKPLKRVLDAGTGTGIWAIEFGAFSVVGWGGCGGMMMRLTML